MQSEIQELEAVFLAATEILDPGRRAHFLATACKGNAEFKHRVEALLRAHEQPCSLLDLPAVAPRQRATSDLPAFGCGPVSLPAAGHEDPCAVPLTFLARSGRADSLGRIDRYEILQVLGRGGFGIVFRALDELLHRVVAVKVLLPHVAATSPARKRFLREARAAAAVRHENVVQLYDIGEQPLPYIAMEFIPGETLQQKLDRGGPLEVAEVLRIGRQIAEGLAAAHHNDLIHLDIKPGNILLEPGAHGRVKITDFGLARAADEASRSQSGAIAGTPMYMAPEQALGEPLDSRADLFSLGSVLYQMVTGRPPFVANGTLAVLKRVAEGPARPVREIIPETPPWLGAIIDKLHAKKPADRYPSAQAVADLLAECEAQIRAHGRLKDFSRIPPLGPGFGRPGKWKRVAFATLLLPLIALAVGIPWLGGLLNGTANTKGDPMNWLRTIPMVWAALAAAPAHGKFPALLQVAVTPVSDKEQSGAGRPASQAADRSAEDLDILKSARIDTDPKALLGYLQRFIPSKKDRQELDALVRKLGDDSFSVRESASRELVKRGPVARAALKRGCSVADAEVARRCRAALTAVETAWPTRVLGPAIRTLGRRPVDGAGATLLDHLLLAQDEERADEIRGALAALAVRDGKADKDLQAALRSADPVRRGAAAEALARCKDVPTHAKLKAFLAAEKDPDIRLRVVAGLVEVARDKTLVGELIEATAAVPAEKGERGEELLFRLAGDQSPTGEFGPDRESRVKAAGKWKKWLKANKAKLNLTRLDENKRNYGLTLILTEGAGGPDNKILALGPDGKERWRIEDVDACDVRLLPGGKLLVPELRAGRVVERTLANKEPTWSVSIGMPRVVGKLPGSGIVWVVANHSIVEFSRDKKEVFRYDRPQEGIFYGGRTKDGEYVFTTQSGKLIQINRQGKEIRSWVAGNNRLPALYLLPNGKVLVGGDASRRFREFDLNTGKATFLGVPSLDASSVQKLPNGNFLVCEHYQGRVVEYDREGKEVRIVFRGKGLCRAVQR
jgi:serine/threonine protein kinase